MLRLVSVGALLTSLLVAFHPATPADDPFDLLITGGRVLDGTGNPWFYADIGIRGDRIVAIGDLAGQPAERVIDAQGQVVTPGFIDLHSHADDGSPRYSGLRDDDARRRAAMNLVMQGITTVVVNHDGRSPWPIGEQRAAIEAGGIGPNAILLVGHGTVRRQVMAGDYRRPATEAEVQAMRRLVRQGLADGAWGLSAGLEYVPGRWSTTDEVVALVEEIAPVGGVYISHQRSEGPDPMWYWPTQDSADVPDLLQSVMETIEIGERTGATVVASHLKAKGAHYWGTSHAVIGLIDRARARGVPVYGDQYPYNTSGTDGNTMLIPGWAFAEDRWTEQEGDEVPYDYTATLRRLLADADTLALLQRDVAHEIRRRGGPDNVLVLEHPVEAFVGQTLAELAEERGVSPVQMAFDLQLEGDPHQRGGGRMRGFSMDEADLDALAAQPWMATVTDGGIAMPGDDPVHPRFYGTFPRKIRRYAIERGALSVPDAVRSATSLPAQILGLKDRGVLREGALADLAVLDLDDLRDTATFFEPHQYAEGVVHVLIGGTVVVEDGLPTGALAGQVLTLAPTRTALPADD